MRTIFFSENPNELCNELKLLLQEKQAGKISNKINEEIVAIIDKFSEYKSITAPQHKKTYLKIQFFIRYGIIIVELTLIFELS